MMGRRDQDVVVSIPEEKHSRAREEKMGMKKKKSNKGSSHSASNYNSEGASWSISNTNISLIKNLRSNSLPPDSQSDHHTTSPNHKANSQLKPSSSNPRLNKLQEGTQESTHDPTTMNIRGSDDEDESEEIYSGYRVSEMGSSLSAMFYVQCVALALLLGLLLASFYLDKLKQYEICGVLLWKWSIMALVLVCGELVTSWVVQVLAFLIEKKLILKNKALYYVYGLKKSLQICIWMPSFLLTRFLLFDRGFGQSSPRAKKILGYIWRTFASALLVVVVAELKSFLVKKLSASFYANNFFRRIQERIYNKYIIQRLAGEKAMEAGQLGFDTAKEMKKGSVERGVINVEKLQKLSDQDSVSAWTMNGLVNAITSGLISTSADQGMETETDEEESLRGSQLPFIDRDEADPLINFEMSNEMEARFAASSLFRNCAKPGCKYIEEDDLLVFFNNEEVANIFPMFEGAVETGKISKKAFRNWMDKVYSEHRNLAFVLEDNRKNIKQVNKLGIVVVILMAPLIWLLLMGFPPAPVAIFLASVLLPCVFLFGNTIRALFDSLVFIFVMHPFDVGDRCIVDGEEMVVEEMQILKTAFLTATNEKAYYPNAILAIKPIKNLYRSPDMNDYIDFTIDASTPIETLEALKRLIESYLESKPRYWRRKFELEAKEFESLGHLKMRLHLTHTTNHQNMGKKISRKSELVLELKQMLEKVGVGFHLLPQELHVHHTSPPAFSPTAGATLPSAS